MIQFAREVTFSDSTPPATTPAYRSFLKILPATDYRHQIATNALRDCMAGFGLVDVSVTVLGLSYME